MSVVAGKRGEGELLVITRANELLSHTIKICSNEKHFPKRYRWCVTNKLIDTTTDVVNHLIHANAVYVRPDDGSLKRRLTHQREALELTYVLLNEIDVAYKLFSIESASVEHWTGMIIELQRLIRSWNKKDKERYNG